MILLLKKMKKNYSPCFIFLLFALFLAPLCVFGVEDTASDGSAHLHSDPDTLLMEANSAREEQNRGKALALYQQFLSLYPGSEEAEQARKSRDELFSALQQLVFHEALLRQMKSASALPSRQLYTYESAVMILNEFPMRKLVMEAQARIKETLVEEPVRFRVRYVGDPGAALQYTGNTIRDGNRWFAFLYGNYSCSVPLGGTVLFYRVTGYDELTDSIELTQIKNVPYKLLQAHKNPYYRAFSCSLFHVPMKRSFSTFFYFDLLEYKLGKKVPGIVKEQTERSVTFDIPNASTMKTYQLDADEINMIHSFAVGHDISALNRKFVNDINKDGTSVYEHRLEFYMATEQWLKALIMYITIADKQNAQSKHLCAIWKQLIAVFQTRTVSELELNDAVYCLKNGYIFSALRKALDVIATYHDTEVAVEAQQIAFKLSRKQELLFYITDINPIPFPIAFMGYNQDSNGEELYQINYRKRTYFMTAGEQKGGIQIDGSTYDTVELLNPSLNTRETHELRWLIVKPASSDMPITLTRGEAHIEPEKVYVEIEDMWSGKRYPGYILLDSLIVKGERQYGVVMDKPSERSYVLFPDFSLRNPHVIPYASVSQTDITSSFKPKSIEIVEDFLGKLAFSEIRKYYTLDDIDQIATTEHELPEMQLTDQDELDSLEHEARDKNIVTDKKTDPVPDKQAVASGSDEPDNNELEHRQKKLSVKKNLIKVLGALILVWLLYMLVKMSKLFNSK